MSDSNLEHEGDFYRASKNPLGERLVYNLLIRPSLRRAFGGVYVYVHPEALRLRRNPPMPVIFCMNHSGWFDGYVAALINRLVFQHDGYMMMEQKRLDSTFFFTWVGVFGINRESPRSAVASLQYSAEVLAERPGRSLWMFPQGMVRHSDYRPVELYNGTSNIARRLGKCALVPVAARYDFLEQQPPEAFARIGPPIFVDAEREPVNQKELTERLTAALTAEMDTLRGHVVAYDHTPYRKLLSGRQSVDQVWDGVLQSAGRAFDTVRGKRPQP
ncbi:MAG TPA: lysophospholipid acyltransferase family protein [Chloroflexia bacterium]|nr:lysophospholipid acyltransferase family protein [Chloroflexia bacterium]